TLTKWVAEPGRTWREVLSAYKRAGAGLAAAHDVGLVHRDFKPDNVLVGQDGSIHVTDFGLARLADATAPTEGIASDSAQAVARPADTVGPPAYMAPEQFRGRAADQRTDQFSFCVALYEGLYGQRPFAGDTVAQVRQNIIEDRVAD